MGEIEPPGDRTTYGCAKQYDSENNQAIIEVNNEKKNRSYLLLLSTTHGHGNYHKNAFVQYLAKYANLSGAGVWQIYPLNED